MTSFCDFTMRHVLAGSGQLGNLLDYSFAGPSLPGRGKRLQAERFACSLHASPMEQHGATQRSVETRVCSSPIAGQASKDRPRSLSSRDDVCRHSAAPPWRKENERARLAFRRSAVSCGSRHMAQNGGTAGVARHANALQRLPPANAAGYGPRMSTTSYGPFLVIVCACSDPAASPDAMPPDVMAPDSNNGTCDSMLRLTGAYEDWDSSATAFCGIFGAEFTVQGGGATSTTAPNGRFDLCIPDAAQVLVDIKPPTAESQCANPRATYSLPGIAVADRAVIVAGGAWSARAFVTSRQLVDPTKAQVFVHVSGIPRKVTVNADHASTQARTNDTWSTGDTGNDVFFLDVDPSGGAAELSADGAIGGGSIPLVAGKVTYVSIVSM